MILGEEGKLVRFVRSDLLFVSTANSGYLYGINSRGQQTQQACDEQVRNVVGLGCLGARIFFGRSNGEVVAASLSDLGTLYDFSSFKTSSSLCAFDVSIYGHLLTASKSTIELTDYSDNHDVLFQQQFPFQIKSAAFWNESDTVALIGNFFSLFDIRSASLTATVPVLHATCFARHNTHYVAVGAATGEVSLFDVRKIGEPVESDRPHENAVASIASLSDGKVCSGAVDGSMALIDFASPDQPSSRSISEDGVFQFVASF